MKSKEFKTKIYYHADSLILSLAHPLTLACHLFVYLLLIHLFGTLACHPVIAAPLSEDCLVVFRLI